MNYKEALSFIGYTNKLGSVLGLDSISRLLKYLENPEKDLKFIHIGGTNGKGSTSSFISSVLRAGNYDVGLFTSPHMVKFNESIVVNGEEIPDRDFARIMGIIEDKSKLMVEDGYNHPTTFEIITGLSFLYFKERKVDYVVLEVGLGGKNDSTNIIPSSLISVFTPIDYDHIDILGSSIEEIGEEKAGIIKENSLALSYPQEKSVLEILGKRASEKNTSFYVAEMERIKNIKSNEEGSQFDYLYENMDLDNIRISMLGQYQVYNSALAIATILLLKENKLVDINEEAIKKGLREATWPGRLELLRTKPKILLDGAHNLQGIKGLKKAIDLFKYRKIILCMGVLKDKDYDHMVEEIVPVVDYVIATQVDNPRKLDAEDLARAISKYNNNLAIEKDIDRALKLAIEKAGPEDLIIFCGSLYLMGQIREKIRLLY